MKYTDRKEFLYDMALAGRGDVATAMKIHKDYVQKMSPMPAPKFLEVDRASSQFDALWHMPLDSRTHFSREIDIKCIVQQERPDWKLTKVGIAPQQKRKFTMDNLLLQEADYFPQRGDLIFYDGYRNLIVNVVLEPNGFWNQTNVWLGLICETIIPVDGDARPLTNVGEAVPAEKTLSRPVPEA